MKKFVLTLCAAALLVPAVTFAQQPVPIQDVTKAPVRTKYVAPVYPREAQSARVSGTVVIEAVIGPDGIVKDAKILRSIALLDEPALAAVRQWEYTPTTLNGQPVPVIMTVSVNFTLRDRRGMSAPVTAMSPSAVPPEPVLLKGKEVLRIGGNVKAPERVKYVQPVYPADMLADHVSGIVIIEAIIDETGHVAQTKVLRSVPGFDQAAVDAVMQWEYTPTLLNGLAVPVLMTVTVNFSMK
jgi:TonB family protein